MHPSGWERLFIIEHIANTIMPIPIEVTVIPRHSSLIDRSCNVIIAPTYEIIAPEKNKKQFVNLLKVISFDMLPLISFHVMRTSEIARFLTSLCVVI
jgi:hypothetical protein